MSDRVTPAAVEQETVTVFAKPLPVAEVLREARLMVEGHNAGKERRELTNTQVLIGLIKLAERSAVLSTQEGAREEYAVTRHAFDGTDYVIPADSPQAPLAPRAPLSQQIEDLIERWRDLASAARLDCEFNEASNIDQCANELEQLLASVPASAPRAPGAESAPVFTDDESLAVSDALVNSELSDGVIARVMRIVNAARATPQAPGAAAETMPVELTGEAACGFYEPTLRRLPEWLTRFAESLERHEGNRDLYMQEISGLEQWAKIVSLLLSRAAHPSPAAPQAPRAPETPADPQRSLIDAQAQLVYWWRTMHRCPCGAREESPDTHHHVPGCPTERALSDTPLTIQPRNMEQTIITRLLDGASPALSPGGETPLTDAERVAEFSRFAKHNPAAPASSRLPEGLRTDHVAARTRLREWITEDVAGAEALTAIIAEMSEWLSVGGLFNPEETSVVTVKGRNAILDWRDRLSALAAPPALTKR